MLTAQRFYEEKFKFSASESSRTDRRDPAFATSELFVYPTSRSTEEARHDLSVPTCLRHVESDDSDLLSFANGKAPSELSFAAFLQTTCRRLLKQRMASPCYAGYSMERYRPAEACITFVSAGMLPEVQAASRGSSCTPLIALTSRLAVPGWT